MGQMNWDKTTKYVLIGMVVILSIFLFRECNKPQPLVPPQPTVIQQLKDDKQNTDQKVDQTTINYDNKTTKRSQNVKDKNKKHVEDIKRLPSTDSRERDSLWTILLNSKDSLPTGYWNLLEQRARRKSP
jgi:hypothetical protein